MSRTARQRPGFSGSAYTAAAAGMEPAMKILVTMMLFATMTASAAVDDATDRWGRMRFLLGSWQGEASGESGKGTVERTYTLVLGGQFIEEHNISRYSRSSPGRDPEVHRHRGFISYDKARKTFMLRHFHEEG